MIVTERKPVPGSHSHAMCDALGCNHSGRYIARFLDSYDVRLCASCRTAWAKAWHDARTNWQATA